MNHTDVFTEEGMTRLRNFQRRTAGYIAVWLLCGLVVTGLLFWLQIKYGLQPLQRIYLRSYAMATLKTRISKKSQSTYILLVRTATDPQTGKELLIKVTDDEAYPVLDADGRIISDSKLWLLFRLRPGIPHNYFFWRPGRGRDLKMLPWMRENIYDGIGLFGLCAPALICGSIVFFVGLTLTLLHDRRANKRYEKGRPIRGTRLLSPKEYEREQPDATGIGIVVFERTGRAT